MFREEKRMSTEVNIAKQVVHDKLESQIKAAEAKLETQKARAGKRKQTLRSKRSLPCQTAGHSAEAAGIEGDQRRPVGADENRSRGTDRRIRKVRTGDRIEGEVKPRPRSAMFVRFARPIKNGCITTTGPPTRLCVWPWMVRASPKQFRPGVIAAGTMHTPDAQERGVGMHKWTFRRIASG
jgi:hypothetical protein